MAKAFPLIKAYMNEEIPPDGGFIVSAFFQPGTIYAIYEITAYRNVKDIFKSEEGYLFKTDGNRTHILIEPATFAKKYIEPVNREVGKSVPYRFSEMEIFNCAGNEKAMVPHEPVMLYSSFTILQQESEFFSFVFYPTEDVLIAMKKFIADSLYNDCNLTKRDALKVATQSIETVKRFNIWQPGQD